MHYSSKKSQWAGFLTTVLLCTWGGATLAQVAETASTSQPDRTWLDMIKNPTPWLSIGGDWRLRTHYDNNFSKLDKDSAGHERIWQRYRTRLWWKVTPVENLDFNFRLVWEFKQYCKPEGSRKVDLSEVLFDDFNVKWSKAFGLPLTATIGRQNFMLGDGWLVFDGTPRDGTRTNFIDAARLTLDVQEWDTVFDAIYVDQAADSDRWLPVFNDRNFDLVEHDQKGVILYATNKSLRNTELSGYFIYVDEERVMSTGDNADIYTYGGRVQHDFNENWRGRAELAQQLGHKNCEDLCALGFNSRLTYFTRDRWDNQFRLGYEYLSGDDPSTDTNEAFDRLWGRWTQFSNVYESVWGMEGLPSMQTNMHRIQFGWSIWPVKDILELCSDYHLLFADQNSMKGTAGFSDAGHFRGQLFTTVLRYKQNEHLCHTLTGEVFFPGDYYTDDKNDPAVFARYELVISW